MSDLDRTVTAVAELAGIPEDARDIFRGQLVDAIESTHVAGAPDDAGASLARLIADAAAALIEVLARAENADEVTRQKVAVLFQSLAVAGSPGDESETMRLQQAANDPAGWLTDRRSEAARLLLPAGPRHRPPSDFTIFVRLLDRIAKVNGGELTHTKSDMKSARPQWSGTLMQAMTALKPYFPDDFFPRGNLGKALERISRPKSR